MSYILDAIRKAEKQRQEETVPSLEAMVYERKQKHRPVGWRWMIWVGLALVAGLSWYLNRDQFSSWSTRGAERVGEWYHQAESGLLGLFGSKAPGETGGSGGGLAANGNGPQPAPTALTPAQRKLLQQIRFSVISYSADPNKRFAMVENDTLREGDLLEGFTIMRIRKDGVMIDVNGRAVLIRP